MSEQEMSGRLSRLEQVLELPPPFSESVWEWMVQDIRNKVGSFDPKRDQVIRFSCPQCGLFIGTLEEVRERMVIQWDAKGTILWKGCLLCWLDHLLTSRGRSAS